MTIEPAIYDLPCKVCGSSDGVTDYRDHTHCFVCGSHIFSKEFKDKLTITPTLSNFLEDFKPREDKVVKQPTPVDPKLFRELPDRGISHETALFFQIQVNERGEQVYPYYSQDCKRHVANKYRTAGVKGFTVQGELSKSALFGQQLFPASSAKQITIVEGELDAASVFQMAGSKFPVVSVKNAATAPKDVADNFEYLNSFETIVLCFDRDEPHTRPDGTHWYPGQEAAQKVASMFSLGKVRVFTLKDAKDANDYLRNGWGEKFQREWWAAPNWSPVGIKQAGDMWETVKAKKYTKYTSVPYPWDGLNQLTYGLRTSELVVITANPKVGKTSVLREAVFKILNTIRENEEDKRNIGVMFLEEPNDDTLYGLISIYANKPLHLPDILEQTKEEELEKYFKDVYGDERVYLWDHFGSNSISKVLTYVRYLANLGCKYIVLDHLSIIVSDQSGDERKQLDEIATKLKMLTMELGICVICVIHQNRKGEIRGTQGVEQLANIVIKLYRNPLADDEEERNLMKVNVEANRFCGRTGPACLLRYDAETGRLQELPQEDLQKYLDKTNKKKGHMLDEEW